MKPMILAAGAAALLVAAGAAAAGEGKNPGAKAAGPKQPIPYAQLDAYAKASPGQRASQDWWAGSAADAGVNASATTPTTPPGVDLPVTEGAPTAPTGDPLANNPGVFPGDATGPAGAQAPTTVNPSVPSSGDTTPR